MKKIGIILLFIAVILTGCNSTSTNKIVKVNQEEVIELIDGGAILIDVRSLTEFNQGHIDGAINIDVQSILEVEDVLTYNNSSINKNKKIIVYCRSGSRSNSAAEKLVDLGYNYVYDFGSMDNWK